MNVSVSLFSGVQRNVPSSLTEPDHDFVGVRAAGGGGGEEVVGDIGDIRGAELDGSADTSCFL